MSDAEGSDDLTVLEVKRKDLRVAMDDAEAKCKLGLGGFKHGNGKSRKTICVQERQVARAECIKYSWRICRAKCIKYSCLITNLWLVDWLTLKFWKIAS